MLPIDLKPGQRFRHGLDEEGGALVEVVDPGASPTTFRTWDDRELPAVAIPVRFLETRDVFSEGCELSLVYDVDTDVELVETEPYNVVVLMTATTQVSVTAATPQEAREKAVAAAMASGVSAGDLDFQVISADLS